MKQFRQILKPVGLLLAVFMFMLAGPCQSAMAAMIETEAVVDSARAHNAREYLKAFLAYEDVKSTLVSRELFDNIAIDLDTPEIIVVFVKGIINCQVLSLSDLNSTCGL